MLDHANAGFRSECERQDLAAGNVPGVVRLGELRQREPAIRQADGRLWPGTAKWRAGPKEEAQVCRRVGLGVNCIGGAQQGLEAYQGRELSCADSQKRARGIQAETQRPKPRGVIERKHIINVPIRLLHEDLLAHGTLDKDSTPAIRAAILDCAKQHRTVLGTGLKRQRGGIDGKGAAPFQPFRRILKRNRQTTPGGVQQPHEPSLPLPLDVDFPTHVRGRRMRCGRRRSSKLRASASLAGAARPARRSCN